MPQNDSTVLETKINVKISLLTYYFQFLFTASLFIVFPR